jgi:hypothetical protein
MNYLSKSGGEAIDKVLKNKEMAYKIKKTVVLGDSFIKSFQKYLKESEKVWSICS